VNGGSDSRSADGLVLDRTCSQIRVLDAHKQDIDSTTEPAQRPQAIFCAVRELLLNVVKHAGVSEALISPGRERAGSRLDLIC
jgi:signal transduction histidine kinase